MAKVIPSCIFPEWSMITCDRETKTSRSESLWVCFKRHTRDAIVEADERRQHTAETVSNSHFVGVGIYGHNLVEKFQNGGIIHVLAFQLVFDACLIARVCACRAVTYFAPKHWTTLTAAARTEEVIVILVSI